MTKLVFLKAIIGSSVLVGSATTGTYFGSKTTVEQYLNKNQNLNKISSDEKWEESFGKISKRRETSVSGTEIQSPQSETFQTLLSDGKNKYNLYELCKEELGKTYEVFWIPNSIDTKLEEDLKAYCFSK